MIDKPSSASAHFKSELFRLAIWFGLLAGLLDALTCFVLRGRPGTTVRVPDEILWISPAFHVTLLLLAAAGLLILFRLLAMLGLGRWQPGLPAVAGLMAAIASFSWLLRFGKVPQYALAVLCIGIGAQVARMMARRLEGWQRFVRRSLPILLALALVLGTGSVLWAGWRESRMVRDLPPAPANAPNVLLITLDTVRADHLSIYGYSRATTPNIDRLAKEGVLFESAFANSSWTLPAHASLLTGRLPHEHQANWKTPVNASHRTLAEAFAERGYRTAAFSANTSYVSPEWGLGKGFARFEVYGASLLDDVTRTALGMKMAKVILPLLGDWDIPGRKRAGQVNGDFLRWLDTVRGRPFFAFLNYMEAHDPYLTEPAHMTKFSQHVTQGDVINFQFQPNQFRRKESLTAGEIAAEINSYDGCLAYLDHHLGALLATLQDRGLKENTLVIITSDHGEAFGNHDLFGHGNSLYLETLHVPLVFYWPGNIPQGRRLTPLAGLNQVPATVSDLLGWQAAEHFPGESLARYWSGEIAKARPRAVVSELGRNDKGPATYPSTKRDLQSLIADQWHLILSSDGATQLFAWRSDPRESEDLAQTDAGRVVVEELRQKLMSLQQAAREKGTQPRP